MDARGRPERDASGAKPTNTRTSHVACAHASPERPARLKRLFSWRSNFRVDLKSSNDYQMLSVYTQATE